MNRRHTSLEEQKVDKKLFGTRINKARKDRGLTAEKLAEACNINSTYLRQIEGGKKLPSLPVFATLCRELRVSPNYRETWRVQSAHRFEADAKIEFRAGGPLGKIQFPGGCSDSESREAFDQFIAKWSTDSKWNPSIFMPKEAARIFLKIVDVSVERLGDINGGGLKAEGIDRNQPYRAMRMDFRDLWNSTISADQLDELGWYANPWVFVYKFQQIGREEALA